MKSIRQIPFDDALIELVKYANRQRTSPTADRALVRALVSMRLRGDQLKRVGAYVELWRHDGAAWGADRVSFEDANRIALLPARKP